MNFQRVSLPLVLLVVSLGWLSSAAAEPVFELVQDREAVVNDQSLVGNSKAQAKTRGTIRNVPQLFVYQTDLTSAFHQNGYRQGFSRFLELAVRSYREERSMVGLDKLLERAHLPDDGSSQSSDEYSRLVPEDLPSRNLTIVYYYSEDCQQCEAVELELAAWLASNSDLDYNYLRVALNYRRVALQE